MSLEAALLIPGWTSLRSCPHAAAISTPRSTRTVALMPARCSSRWKARTRPLVGRAQVGPGRGVVRDQVDVGVDATDAPRERARLLGRVVDVVQQCIGERDTTPSTLDVIASGVEQVIDRGAGRCWDQPPPQLVVRRMQRDRQADLPFLVGQPRDGAWQSDRGDGDAALAQIEPAFVDEPVDRAQRGVEVGERLAHAHKHHVRDAPLAREVEHLGDDLVRCQVAGESLQAGRAEHAAHRAAHLGRDADGRPSARGCLVGVVIHPYRLDGVATAEVEQHLRRCAVVGGPLGQYRQRVEAVALCELRPQRFREVGHLLEARRAVPQHPAHHLARR